MHHSIVDIDGLIRVQFHTIVVNFIANEKRVYFIIMQAFKISESCNG